MLAIKAFNKSWRNCHRDCYDERLGTRGGRKFRKLMKRSIRSKEKINTKKILSKEY